MLNCLQRLYLILPFNPSHGDSFTSCMIPVETSTTPENCGLAGPSAAFLWITTAGRNLRSLLQAACVCQRHLIHINSFRASCQGPDCGLHEIPTLERIRPPPKNPGRAFLYSILPGALQILQNLRRIGVRLGLGVDLLDHALLGRVILVL